MLHYTHTPYYRPATNILWLQIIINGIVFWAKLNGDVDQIIATLLVGNEICNLTQLILHGSALSKK